MARVASAERISVLDGRSRVRALAFHPGGSLLGTSSDDRRIRLWEVPTGRCLAVLEGHTEPAHALGFTADGALLGSLSQDGSTRAWGVSTG